MKKFVGKFSFLLLFSVFCLLSFQKGDVISDQKIDKHAIMFKINSELTIEQAEEIDAVLATKDGVLASRTTPEIGVYFCYTLKSKDLSEDDFAAWFQELGYKISCFNKIEQGVGEMKSYEEIINCKQ